MPGAMAHLRNANGNVIDSATTNNYGHYTFQNVAPGNYTITFTTGQNAGGVTLTDAFLVMLKLLNLYTFTPIQTLAADVNGSGNITWTDYFLILIGYLNQGNPFPIGPWVFEQAAVTIPTSARDGFSSRGGSSGDVNGSLVPDPKTNSIFLNNPVINLTQGPSDPIDFNLSGTGNLSISGMHLVIKIPDGLTLLNVESAIPDANISVLKDQVRVTWLNKSLETYNITGGEPLVVVSAITTGVSRDGDSYSLKLSDESHFIDADGELIPGVNLQLPTINLVTKKDIVMTAYPNPFVSSTNLSYTIPADGQVNISVFDQGGRLVSEIVNGVCPAGNNLVSIDGTYLTPGLYYYRITYNGIDPYTNTGTIIKSK
jgi:hypothetical protein